MDRAFYTNLLPLDDQIPYDHPVEQADLHISVTGYPNEDLVDLPFEFLPIF